MDVSVIDRLGDMQDIGLAWIYYVRPLPINGIGCGEAEVSNFEAMSRSIIHP